MTCAELEILLCDYVDGTLSGDQQAAVEQHLAGCAECAQMARDITTAVAFLDQAPEVEPPSQLVTQLLFQIPVSRPRKGLAGLSGLLGRWVQPILQPRFAMGMAMTILSFSLLARFAGIEERQLSPSDLHPAKVWSAVEDRWHRTWDSTVKYYESLRVVYDIQSRLRAWSEEQPAAQPDADTLEPEATPEEPDPNVRQGAQEDSERSTP